MPGDTENEDIMQVHHTRMIRDMNDSIKMLQKVVFSETNIQRVAGPDETSTSNSHSEYLSTSSLLIFRITQQTLAIMASSFHAVPEVHGWDYHQKAIQLVYYLDKLPIDIAQELNDADPYGYDILVTMLTH